ncbi:amino acid/polyamine/organocation transporter, APC superfamily [Cribrihabitans marinus]|uniref:Amino acid/polyamine/organocation transporter, APC superfamily n=1 Tax=Cribrihabitans marinus TaxID=1227549 RepID=A0A1H6ZP54_9RHOB|nr:amino acid permease [Cribrihabitans marinus]GGH30246.1 amino acid transporter [Cribrihabitans marinus]SEJ55219.1 amino acid/polyamine/organocation transporter, APC superfamily [Cribrihabitans marinus]
MSEPLKRRIGPGLLTAYGVGVMVGAGIYVLVGAIAGQAGIWAPLAFLIAGAIAAPTALSYAEFSTRLPEAAGEAAFVGTGLNSQALALLVGLGVAVAGTVSAGAVLRGGVGYLTTVIDIAPAVGIGLLGGMLTLVAIAGVLESLALAAVFTLIELAGLALVVWAGLGAAPAPDWTAAAPPAWTGIGLAGVLAFFAFIGFEDIVNMAEETENPTRTLPLAILISLAITTAIYALVSFAAVRAVPLAELAGSESPLALVWQTARGGGGAFLSTIAVFAALNGVLAQIVMASRVLFGLGKRSSALAVFHRAHPRFGTPVLATALIGTAVILAALYVSLSTLAETTSAILLAVFVLVNTALIVQKRRAPEAAFRVPMAVPVLGLVLALAAFAVAVGGLL